MAKIKSQSYPKAEKKNFELLQKKNPKKRIQKKESKKKE